MTINYTTLLGLAKPVTGTETGQWGDVVNDSITSLLEDAVANASTISVTAGNVTLTTTNGASNQARMSTLILTGTPGTTRNVVAPSQAKIYVVLNQSDSAVVIKGSATTGVSIAAGEKAQVAWTGSDFAKIGSTGGTGVFSSITNTGLTSGRVVYSTTGGLETDSANLTFNGTTLTANTLNLTNALGTSYGGTGLTSFTANGVVYASSTSALATGSALTFDGTGMTIGAAASASTRLTVNGPVQFNASTDTNTYVGLQNTAYLTASGSMVFGANNAEGMRLTSTGLGIGTSSPGTKLEVSRGTTANASATGSTTRSNSALALAASSDTNTRVMFGIDTNTNGWIQVQNTNSNGTADLIINPVGGNLGLGVTPSAWETSNSVRALQLNSGALSSWGTTYLWLGQNWYRNSSGNEIYSTTAAATKYQQYGGTHQWSIAGSGTAGNTISFTQAMTLDASGNLLVGATSSTYSAAGRGVIEVNGSSNSLIAWKRNGSASAYLYATSSEFQVNNTEATPMTFYVNGSERARIDSSGNLGIGTTSPTVKLEVANSDALIYGVTVGRGAGAVSTNTAVGASALASNNTANQHTAVGYQALQANTSASRNTAVGYLAGTANTSGHVTAIGAYVLYSNTSGNGNTGVGGNDEGTAAALQSNTTGSYNTAVGTSALGSNTTASNNTAVGYQAGYTGTTATRNTLVGFKAGYALTTGSTNTFIGVRSDGIGAAGAAITTGSNNTIIGGFDGNNGALDIRTASNYIVLSDGDGNPRGVFDGSGNFLVGGTSFDNGSFSPGTNGLNVVDATHAIALVKESTTGSKGYIAVYGSGYVVGTPSNIYMSFVNNDTERGRFDTNGYLLVGYGSSNGAYKLQVNSQIFATSSTIATSDAKYKENVQTLNGALDIVKALRPVQFSWKQHPVHAFDTSTPTVGFLAQEVQQVLADRPFLNSIIKSNTCTIEIEEKDENGVITKPAVTEDFLGIAEGNMIAILTSAIQEQQAIIEQLKADVAALKGTTA